MTLLEELIIDERRVQEEFRREMRTRLTVIESWVDHQKGASDARGRMFKKLAWLAGTAVAAAGVILPLWFR